MTKAEQIRYRDVKIKAENEKAKREIAEQESSEKDKIIAKLMEENEKLRKENECIKNGNKEITDKLFDEIGNLNEEIVELKDKKTDAKTIKKLQEELEKIQNTAMTLKSGAIKDSTNSGKPSSTNGFKKVIQNNREKSGKKKGGQKGREGKTLKVSENPDKIIDVYGEKKCSCGGNIIYDIEHIKRQVIDLMTQLETIEYRFHKGVCEKCGKEYQAEIPQNLNNPIQYSQRARALVASVKNISNMSVYTTKEVFKMLFNGFEPSIGWIHKLDGILAKKCAPMIDNITENLENSELANADETGAKVEDKLGCCISFSNDDTVLYGMYKSKSKASFDEFGIFEKFKGILMHDHNITYYKYKSIIHAECNVHILRYLKYVIDLFQREGAKKLREFLMDIYTKKLDATARGESGFSEEKIKEIETEYLRILDEWEKEYNKKIEKLTKISKPYKDERNLFTRLREYKEQHLLFIKDFKVPFSNNAAERNLRSIKIKMNISKRFGTLECAENFATIKSVIETAKKRKMNILEIITKAFEDNCDDIFKCEVA